MKVGLPLVKILTQLAKNVLVPLGLMAVASATDAAIQKKKKKNGSGMHLLDLVKQTTLITSNEEMRDIMKIVKSFEESGLLIKGVSKKIENKAK